jgi:hypothetical protein
MAIEPKILTFGTNKVGTIGGKLMGYTIPVPLSIPNISLWLNNDDGTMVKNISNRISQWADSSPNGRNFIQSTGANQPLYVNNVVNGQAGVFFADNTAQRLVSTFLSNIGVTNSITIVWSQQAPRSRDFYVFDGVASNANRNLLQWDSNNLYSFRGSLITVKTTAVSPYPIVISTVENNTTATASKYFENGVQIGANFNNGTGLIDGLTLGNRVAISAGLERTLNGYIHELIIHSKAYTTEERTKLTDYLKTKYGIL